jgi:hypothetical protein
VNLSFVSTFRLTRKIGGYALHVLGESPKSAQKIEATRLFSTIDRQTVNPGHRYFRAILQGVGLERNSHQQSRLSTIAIAHKEQRKALVPHKLVITAF